MTWPFFLILIFIVSISFGLFFYVKKKSREDIYAILSNDEILIIKEIKNNVTKQKEISRNLNFSKSKMSKVIAKLEQKKLISKEPHFKTNIIKLIKKIIISNNINNQLLLFLSLIVIAVSLVNVVISLIIITLGIS